MASLVGQLELERGHLQPWFLRHETTGKTSFQERCYLSATHQTILCWYLRQSELLPWTLLRLR
jgi:hypothetical protein